MNGQCVAEETLSDCADRFGCPVEKVQYKDPFLPIIDLDSEKVS